MTPDDPNTGGSCAAPCTTGSPSQTSVDLYMYDLPDSPGADPGDGTLTRVSAGPTGNADPNVSSGSTAPAGNDPAGSGGALRLLSDDGSRAYFTTAAPLPGVVAGDNGSITGPAGTPTTTTSMNVYLFDMTTNGAARWRYVAQLPATSALGSCAATGTRLAHSPFSGRAGVDGTLEATQTANCWRGNGDGSFVSFFTDGRLTASDPDAVSGDMYAYDAEADELVHLTASQGGLGASYLCLTTGPGNGTHCYGDPGMTHFIARGLLNVISLGGSADSRVVVFESASRLVAGDHNDVFDVYMWRDGVLSLLSTGAAAADDALYRGADRAGQNIYLSTRDRLTWEDRDDVLDVYVARLGGGFAEPEPPVACAVLADACQGGGFDLVSSDTKTQSSSSPSGDNVSPRARKSLSLRTPSASQRRKAARTGRLTLRVRTNRAGVVRLTARGKIGKKMRRVGRASKRLSKPGATTVRIKFNRVALKQLRRGRKLTMSVQVRSPGARPRSVKVSLRRAGR